jgi:DNA-binding protein H-NS
MIDELWETSIAHESEKVGRILTKEKQEREKAREESIDETHFEVEDTAKIGEVTTKDGFGGEEESSNIIASNSEERFLEKEH